MMNIGFIGLGKMGYNMVLNLFDHDYEVVAYNRSLGPRKRIARRGVPTVASLSELTHSLKKPRIIWIMITAGRPVDMVLSQVVPHLSKEDIVIDGGNSYFEDSLRRARLLKSKGIRFLGVGVSGGVSGARHGASMMVGGDASAFQKTKRVFEDLCVKDGVAFLGSAGSGHYVKMVHNAIEYGMMGAIAEGMCALKDKQKCLGFSMSDVLKVYANGSIIEGRLMQWLQKAWKRDPGLKGVKGIVPVGGTEAEIKKLEKLSTMPILRQARKMRVASRTIPSFCGKVIASLRREFGGHDTKK
ncbi:decarboxylating 6-phosphogluconate dehydrogenase [Candidatus Woesearchaeota archaeon]|nr:decarboxylating 6-phosphogluconate dehydrogenase [Candidatus Woesearchaeota archaeon]